MRTVRRYKKMPTPEEMRNADRVIVRCGLLPKNRQPQGVPVEAMVVIKDREGVAPRVVKGLGA